MGKKMLLWAAVLSLALFPRTEHADAAFWFQPKRATVDLRLLETSDLHGYMLNYDYAARTEAETYGLALTASLIAAERKAAKNTMLFDDGDLLEGNEMAAYAARRPLKKGEVHPFIRVMNHLNYDAATVGNHDFHYGLDFLKQTISGAKFPFVNANIYYNFEKNDTDDQNFFKPYVILNKKVEDRHGHSHHLKIGVIGFVTPSVIEWEKPSLGGKVKAKDILHTAAWFVPRMKAEGADLIIALAHCGVDPAAKQPFYTGDAVYLLSEVKGIDAILFGHQHRVFPSKFFAGVPGVDIRKGTINGVPAVMPGKWGSHLGVISLTLEKKGEKWEMTEAQSEAKPVYATHNQQAKSIVRPNPDIVRMTAELQKNVLGSKFTLYSRN
ncbi:metallophosphoesterase [Heyndrickxia coagulans]|uniref:metallophosphoesterase n=1 Tax=Heyndrickxia coagulans TaxID=1398 RepID=UPI001F31432A|nr:metallophosphoesterase [Heyndrickxia coagulans]UJZ87017.1 metallophosphoesterase [Heyndrickxia coagulans]